MSYRILTKNGVDNLNTDGARDYNFVTGGKSGIVDGILNNCEISIQSGNQIVINTGELRLSGHRVVIDEAETKTLLNIPANNRTIYLIAQISIDTNRNVLFDLLFSETTATRKDNLSKVSLGIYQLELSNFTQTTTGELINLKITAPLLNMNFQEKLVSGNNIKTINGQSLLGAGNIITGNSGNLGGNISQKVLWENPNPLQSFSAQSITLTDSENYDYYLVKYHLQIKDSLEDIFCSIGGIYGQLTYFNRAYSVWGDRSWILKNNILTISNAFYGSTSNTINNDLFIPYQLIGIKLNLSSEI